MHFSTIKRMLLKTAIHPPSSMLFWPLAVALALLAQPTTAQRLHTCLDHGWKFHLGDAADPAKDFNFRTVSIFVKSGKAEGTAIAPDFEDKDWQDISLP